MSNHAISYLVAPLHPLPPFELEIATCRFGVIPSWKHRDVSYGHWIFYWNRTPGGVIETDGESVELNASCAVLISPYTRFSSNSVKPFEHLYIHFYAPPPFDRVQRRIITLPADAANRLFTRLNAPQTMVPAAFLCRALLFDSLAKIPENLFLPEGSAVIDPRIGQTIDFMTRNLNTPCNNAELAARASMSLSAFQQLFRSEIGTPPRQYLKNLRMELAARLLRISGETIDDAARQTGYADRYQFSKAFRAFFHMPPGAYRRTALTLQRKV